MLARCVHGSLLSLVLMAGCSSSGGDEVAPQTTPPGLGGGGGASAATGTGGAARAGAAGVATGGHALVGGMGGTSDHSDGGGGGQGGAPLALAPWCDVSHASSTATGVGACASGWCWEAPLPAFASGESWASDEAGVWIASSGIALQVGQDVRVVPLPDGFYPIKISGFHSEVWVLGIVDQQETHLSRIDGAQATDVSLGILPTGFAVEISVAASGDVWIAGDAGLTHVDASGVTNLPWDSGGFAHVSAMGDEVWATDDDGKALRVVNGAITVVPTPFSGGVHGVRVRGPNDVVFFASGGLVHFDGTSWSTLPASPQPIDNPIEIDSAGQISTPTDTGIAVFDGISWTSTPTAPGLTDAKAIHRVNGELWYVAAAGLPATREKDGALLSPFTGYGAGKGLAGYAWNDVWAGGRGGVLHFDGAAWSFTALPSDVPFDAVEVTRGTGPDDVWAWTHAEVFHFDGVSFSTSPGAPAAVSAISVVSPTSVWALAAASLFHFDGSAWSVVDLPPGGPTFPLSLVALSDDDVIIGTLSGYRRVGKDAEDVHDGLAYGHFLLLPGRDLWGVASRGLVHWTGSGWQPVEGSDDVGALAGCNAEDLWTTGEYATAHFDGKSWTTYPAHPGAPVGTYSLFTSGGGNLLAMGAGLTRRRM